MKCPLIIIAAAVNNRKNMIEPADCLKEECAWWDKESQQCAVLVISEQLYHLNGGVRQLSSKIPLGGKK